MYIDLGKIKKNTTAILLLLFHLDDWWGHFSPSERIVMLEFMTEKHYEEKCHECFFFSINSV